MDVQPLFLEKLGQELYEVSCSPLTPSSIRRYFLLLIRSHFSDPDNYGEDLSESLGCLWYNPDEQGAPLDVRLTGVSGNKRHEVVVGLHNIRGKSLVFDDVTGVSEDNSVVTRTMPTTAELSIKHVSPSADTAMDMAWTNLCFLLGFKEPIRSSIGLSGMKIGGLQSVAEEEKPPKPRFRVDLKVELIFNCSVATTQEGHRLKRIVTEQTAKLS